MTNSQLKKQEIEKKIQAIEQRFDNKFQATKETIELGKSPQKLVSKRHALFALVLPKLVIGPLALQSPIHKFASCLSAPPPLSLS